MADEDIELTNATTKTPKFTLDGCVVRAKCVKVYDGDTAQFVFRHGEGRPLFRYSCRMMGYNSAEIHGESAAERAAAQLAKAALAEKILGKVVLLNIGKFDKYGRPLVVVYNDIENINKSMVAAGHGQPYTGQGEKKW